MKIFKKPPSSQTELNITSLIDIIFILLIFFMVSSSFIKPSISVKLPVAATKDESPKKKLNLYISADLALFIDKEELTLPQIQERIAAQIEENPDLVVMLFCDKSVIFEQLVKVIDALKLTGVKNVAISRASA
ncbi:MAG: ExbD/TolR family protein [Brevinema sp.]